MRALELCGVAADYQSDGHQLRWRYRVGSVPLELRTPRSRSCRSSACASRSFGSLRFRRRSRSATSPAGHAAALRLRSPFGADARRRLDRFDVRRFA
jgi:hypothetical protein